MSYAIDTEGAGASGATLLASGAALRDCGTLLAHAGGLAQRGVGADHPALAATLREFVTAHLAAVEVLAAACAGLGRGLTWAAQSAHETELAVASGLGARGMAAPGATLRGPDR
ncbi:hypothetical protein [Intrasporangium sp.]|uniref:hypothetical protein n=1 Tax=Intrasporangium sp. TaxID=1925024 RepID=UPI00293A4881|nr:hypothetical protein [Intrasporangium sp.]MDV3222482.1 hypothetical protein [Intrasporangium sp.]